MSVEIDQLKNSARFAIGATRVVFFYRRPVYRTPNETCLRLLDIFRSSGRVYVQASQLRVLTPPRDGAGLGGRVRARSVPRYSDGVVFTHFLNPLFESNSSLDDRELVDLMAHRLDAFYRGLGVLLHGRSGEKIKINQPVTGRELCVLMQNKLYEWPASEIESHLFRRSGSGSKVDPLMHVDDSRANQAIGHSPWRTHYERRNVLKHRAHIIGYLRYAEWQLRASTHDSRYFAAVADIGERIESDVLPDVNLYSTALGDCH
jgi:hypothetical protein